MDNTLAHFLQDQGIRFVRIVWCDTANIIRGKAFHTQFLDEHQEHGIGISMAQQAIPAMQDVVAANSGLGPVGEVWLAPDWTTFNALPYAPGHGRVMGNMMHQGLPWALCPRDFLRRMIAQANQQGLQFKAAFEHEFYLLHPSEEGITPADHTVFAATLGMDINQTVIDAITDALIAQGIPVERYYPESGPGQQEISIRYTHPLQAADWQIMFRETVRGVALRHGLKASFLPKIFADQAGSGCHLHLSLWQNDQNQVSEAPGRLSNLTRQFIGGLLHHLPAVMALTTPSPNSYRRLQPHCWSGAFQCWGFDNREAAVRIPGNPTGAPTHFELKTVDASANPYLALGAVIAAGLDGIQHDRDPGEPVAVDPGHILEMDRWHRKINRLPATLGEAIAALSKNSVISTALGKELSQAVLAVRRAEWDAMKGMNFDEEVKLLLERY